MSTAEILTAKCAAICCSVCGCMVFIPGVVLLAMFQYFPSCTDVFGDCFLPGGEIAPYTYDSTNTYYTLGIVLLSVGSAITFFSCLILCIPFAKARYHHTTTQINFIQNNPNAEQSIPKSNGNEVTALAVPIPVPPPIVPTSTSPAHYVTVTTAHLVNENDPVYSQHNIISVPAGENVILLRGTPSTGMGVPYQEYVEISYNGKIGKVSRSCVSEV